MISGKGWLEAAVKTGSAAVLGLIINEASFGKSLSSNVTRRRASGTEDVRHPFAPRSRCHLELAPCVGSGHGFDNARDVSVFVQKDDGRCDIGLPAADCQAGRPPLPGHLDDAYVPAHHKDCADAQLDVR
jgi:hypothetical protein